ncbi:hypothetical protein PGB90_002024 [Kerria lacca]
MNGINIKESLKEIHARIEQAKKNRPDDIQYIEPRLVAVSKTKSVELILEAYENGQRHFGENYPQELISKATNKQILENCPEIKWHFIGHLQSNKAAKIVTLPNLYIIETIDSKKIASILNTVLIKNASASMNVYVQMNTSLEDEDCSHLKFCGLMTIGKYGYDTSLGPNPDFLSLVKSKETVCQELKLPYSSVELSMGMSNDFEQAIELGSKNVRVGSSIFGFRERKTK